MNEIASGLRPNEPAILRDEMVAARAPWSAVLRRGEVLRIVDTHGQQAVDTLLYNAVDFGERYSVEDTIQANRSIYLDRGTRLMSNDGRALATLICDDFGTHDTVFGCCSCEANAVRYGRERRFMHACRENFLIELAKHGMSKRDIVPNVNFFMRVPIEPNGDIAIVEAPSAPGSFVDLRAEMDVLAVISNCPQVNNPCNAFDPTPIRVQVLAA